MSRRHAECGDRSTNVLPACRQSGLAPATPLLGASNSLRAQLKRSSPQRASPATSKNRQQKPEILTSPRRLRNAGWPTESREGLHLG